LAFLELLIGTESKGDVDKPFCPARNFASFRRKSAAEPFLDTINSSAKQP